MLEIVTEAIVLDKEWQGEQDARTHLFTKDLGRVLAKATSARKITSKLNPHLEPLNRVIVRLVQKNHLPQLVDAVRSERLPIVMLAPLRAVKELAAEYEQDAELWAAFHQRAPLKDVLRILGYDPRFAQCEECGAPPMHFSFTHHAFVCDRCLSRAGDCVML